MSLTQTEINEVMSQLQPIIAKALNESTSIQQAQSNIQQGVTQYVGARYVPLFADPIEWNSTRAYEPLTIVLHQGNSYTTRQYTPAGIDIANEEFWAETGNYNAQVEQYRQEVATFDKRITANTNAISELNRQRKILWIGDSFSSDYHNDKNGNWSPVGYLQRYYKMNITNMATDGAGFATGKTFLIQAQNAPDKESYTDVVVYGGANDIFVKDLKTVTEAIKVFWPYVIDNFPKANLWLFACNTPIKSNFQFLYSYLYATQISCNKVKIFSDINAVMLCTNTTQSTTNEHPTSIGGQFLADYFYKALNGSKPTLTHNPEVTTISTDFEIQNTNKYIVTTDLKGIHFPAITLKCLNTVSSDMDLFKVNVWLSSDNNGFQRYIYNIGSKLNQNVGFELKTEDKVIWDGQTEKAGYTTIKLFGTYQKDEYITIPELNIQFNSNSVI